MAIGDATIRCRGCEGQHWGIYGGAGLLPLRRDARGQASHVVLQQRAPASDHGGAWSTLGGALHVGEAAFAGAVREAAEECDIGTADLAVWGRHEFVCGRWTYATFFVEVDDAAWQPKATSHETAAVGWVAVDEVDKLDLHPGFRKSWFEMRFMFN